MATVNGRTPLYTAARRGHETVVRVLIELGADISMAADDSRTPLHIAVHHGHAAIVQILRDAGAV